MMSLITATWSLPVVLAIGMGMGPPQTQPAPRPAPVENEGDSLGADNDLGLFFESEPAGYFHHAGTLFAEGSWKASAAELRRAHDLLAFEAKRATKHGAPAELELARGRLDALAKDMVNGAVTEPGTLQQSFAAAHIAIARHSLNLAQHDWQTTSDHGKVARRLGTAIDNLEAGFSWTGHALDREGISHLSEGIAAAERLARTTTVDKEMIDSALIGLSTELAKLKDVVMDRDWLEPLREVKSSVTPLLLEEAWLEFDIAPDYHLSRARRAFLANEYMTAAREMYRAAAFLRIAHDDAEVSTTRVMSSVDELEQLAYELEGGTVSSVARLDEAFSRAHLALARHYHHKANQPQPSGRSHLPVLYLRAAARHLEHAVKWSGREAEIAASGALIEARLLTQRVKQTAGRSLERLGQTAEAVGRGIETAGRIIEGPRPSSTTDGGTQADPSSDDAP